LIKNVFHDWDGAYVNINDKEPNTIMLFEYNDLNQLVESLSAFQPHLQNQVNYDTLKYNYNNEGLLISRRRSFVTGATSNLIIIQSESRFNYNNDKQIVSDSFFTYDQIKDEVKNSSNQFFKYKEGLLINSTSENVYSQFGASPFDSIAYEYLPNDSIAKKEVWKFNGDMKPNEEERYTYDEFDERLVDEINTVSTFNANINDWYNKSKSEYEYSFFSSDSYSLSRIKTINLITQSVNNTLYEFDETVLESSILFPPNFRYEYYHNHMITAMFRNTNGTSNSRTDYYYSSRTLNTGDIKIDNSMSIYPNPFEDKIQIKSNNANENFILKVFSINGMLLMSTSTRSDEAVNLSGLSPGTYVYLIESNQKIESGIMFRK